MFVFFFSLSALIFHGDWLKDRFMSHMPPVICEWVTRLSAVTVDTLYAIYVVQVAIAVLTFFIALPVFYLLGYGNVLFYSFLAAFCELIPVLGSSSTFLLIGAYALALGDTRGVFILFFLGYLIVVMPSGDLRPPCAGRQAGQDQPGDHVHRHYRGYPHHGPCRVRAGAGHDRAPDYQLPYLFERTEGAEGNCRCPPANRHNRTGGSGVA